MNAKYVSYAWARQEAAQRECVTAGRALCSHLVAALRDGEIVAIPKRFPAEGVKRVGDTLVALIAGQHAVPAITGDSEYDRSLMAAAAAVLVEQMRITP